VGKSIIIPSIIAAVGAVAFFIGFDITVRAAALKTWSRYSSLIPVTCIGMGSAVVADLLIASSMCWFLYHRRTGFAKTDSMITTLMTYSINSGLLTSLFAIAVLISFVLAPTSMIWQIFFWPLGKFYANSLLAMLNSRDRVRDRSTTGGSDNKADNADNAFHLSSLRVDQRSRTDQFKRSGVSVTVQHSATTDFPQGKRDHNLESTKGDIGESVAIIPYKTHDRTSESSV